VENTAGKTAPPAKEVDPNTKEHGKGGRQPPGPTNGVYIENPNNNGNPGDRRPLRVR
jgi:hypothetical protein